VSAVLSLIPEATHRPERELPFVEIMPGVQVQVVHADITSRELPTPTLRWNGI
jgi:hypothetical protein